MTRKNEIPISPTQFTRGEIDWENQTFYFPNAPMYIGRGKIEIEHARTLASQRLASIRPCAGRWRGGLYIAARLAHVEQACLRPRGCSLPRRIRRLRSRLMLSPLPGRRTLCNCPTPNLDASPVFFLFRENLWFVCLSSPLHPHRTNRPGEQPPMTLE